MASLFETDSVRLGIIRKIEAMYKAATTASYGIEFSFVAVGPLGDFDAKKLAAIGIVPGAERKSDLFPLKSSLLEVNVEFRFTVNRGDESPGIMAERVLGVVQQVIYADNTLGGSVIKTNEFGNQIDMADYGDKYVQGVVQFEVHYRHSTDDVFSPDPV
jgi:hypothetical protein